MRSGCIRNGLLAVILGVLAMSAAQLLSAAPGAAQEVASPCQQAPTPGESEITVLSGGMERTAIVNVPPAAAGKRLPLLVGLHSAGGNFFQSYSGFSVLADSEGFIAVYPNSLEEADGVPSGTSIQAPTGPDDVQFISEAARLR